MVAKLSDDQLVFSIRTLARNERKISRAILEHVVEVEIRRLYADLGYSSMFDWLVRDLGYSESAAYRRLQSARLIRAVPEAILKVESGALNLTTLSKTQTAIRNEERRTGTKVDAQTKAEIVSQIDCKSSRETDVKLAQIFPDAVVTPEKVRELGGDRIRVELVLTREQYENIERAREVMSHSHFGASLGEIVSVATSEFLKRRDPLRRVLKQPKGMSHGDTAAEVNEVKARKAIEKASRRREAKSETELSPAEVLMDGAGRSAAAQGATDLLIRTSTKKSPGVSSQLRNKILKKAGAKCEFRDERSGQVCGSRYQVQVDHIKPRALGGDNSSKNLRALCRTHNLLFAERILGRRSVRSHFK